MVCDLFLPAHVDSVQIFNTSVDSSGSFLYFEGQNRNFSSCGQPVISFALFFSFLFLMEVAEGLSVHKSNWECLILAEMPSH